MQTIRDLVAENRFGVFFSLCGGAWDEDRAGREVVEALELFSVPYTGATPGFCEPNKEVTEIVAFYGGLDTRSRVCL